MALVGRGRSIKESTTQLHICLLDKFYDLQMLQIRVDREIFRSSTIQVLVSHEFLIRQTDF